MAAKPALLDRTVEEFRRTLSEIGGQPSSADDAEVLGRQAAMVVLAGGAWERTLGELLTSAEARALLGRVSREALRKRVVSGSMWRNPAGRFTGADSPIYQALEKGLDLVLWSGQQQVNSRNWNFDGEEEAFGSPGGLGQLSGTSRKPPRYLKVVGSSATRPAFDAVDF